MSNKNIPLITETYGLVVCGGNSSRMASDKSMLRYHEKPQRYQLYELLQPFCEKVFISCNAEQAGNMEQGFAFLTDHPSYRNMGPMAALLTAFTRYPYTNILFTGCDYPFLTNVDLRSFSGYCKGDGAVSFYNEQENMYEPLLAWYPFQSFDKLKKMQEAKEYSLQHFLKVTRAVKFYPANKKSLISIDTQEDFIKASVQLIHDRWIFF